MAREPFVYKRGEIVITPSAADALGAAGERPEIHLSRHVYQMRRAYDRGIEKLETLQTLHDGTTIKIITSEDRQQTTISLPDEDAEQEAPKQ